MKRLGKWNATVLDREYASALFLLASDMFAWETIAPHIGPGIDFDALLAIPSSHGEELLLRLAANLFNNSQQVSPRGLITVLGEEMYRLALTAMELRRNRYQASDLS